MCRGPVGKLRAAVEAAHTFKPAEGHELEDYDSELWPENVESFELFMRLQTQWIRAGMDGQQVGLYYPSVYPLIDRQAKTPEDWDRLFGDIQVMEAEAISVIADNKT